MFIQLFGSILGDLFECAVLVHSNTLYWYMWMAVRVYGVATFLLELSQPLKSTSQVSEFFTLCVTYLFILAFGSFIRLIVFLSLLFPLSRF